MATKSFSSWVLNKVISYLSIKEGCTVEMTEEELDRPASIIQDAFGFRYEITVRVLGRTHMENGLSVIEKAMENKQLSFLE